MKTSFYLFPEFNRWAGLVVVLLAGLLGGDGELRAANREARVIVVSIDGLPADYLDDPAVKMPTLQALAKSGARSTGMVAVFPTVTWPNHTSMVTGVSPAKHGVLGNSYYDRGQKAEVNLIWDPLFDKEEIVKVPTVYDVAHLAGLTTAGISWPGSRNAKHLDWQVPCATDAAVFEKYTTPELREMFAQLGVSSAQKEGVRKVDVAGVALGDWMNMQVARQVLRKHRPNLMFLHFDIVDAQQHRNGRNQSDAYWAASLVDHCLQQLVSEVQQAGLAEQTTFVIVSDHGFYNYTKQINGNAVLREAGLIKSAGNRIVESRAYFLSMTGSAALYVTDDAQRESIVRDLTQKFAKVEGVAQVLDAPAMEQLGLPTRATDPRAPDLMLAAAEGYGFSPRIPSLEVIATMSKLKGAHGYLPDASKLHATFIASGAGIKAGAPLGRIRNVDVAPTIAALLGLEMRDVDGRVLTEILK